MDQNVQSSGEEENPSTNVNQEGAPEENPSTNVDQEGAPEENPSTNVDQEGAPEENPSTNVNQEGAPEENPSTNVIQEGEKGGRLEDGSVAKVLQPTESGTHYVSHMKHANQSTSNKRQEPLELDSTCSRYSNVGYFQQGDRQKWPILLSPIEVSFPTPTTHIEQVLQDTVRDPRAEMMHKPNWLLKGITVRVSRGPMYGFVGTVLEIEGHGAWAIATVKTDYDERGRFAVSDLSTVVPSQGRFVRIVQGRHRGTLAKLLDKDDNGFVGTLQITDGLFKGVVLLKVPFSFFTRVGKLSGDSAAEPL